MHLDDEDVGKYPASAKYDGLPYPGMTTGPVKNNKRKDRESENTANTEICNPVEVAKGRGQEADSEGVVDDEKQGRSKSTLFLSEPKLERGLAFKTVVKMEYTQTSFWKECSLLGSG